MINLITECPEGEIIDSEHCIGEKIQLKNPKFHYKD